MTKGNIVAAIFDVRQKLLRDNKMTSVKLFSLLRSTHEAIIVDCEDVLLLRHHEAEAAACAVFEGDARGLGPEDAVDIVAVEKLVVESLRDLDGLSGIAILHDDEVVRLEEWPPLLEEVEITDGGDDNVELIFERNLGHGSW